MTGEVTMGFFNTPTVIGQIKEGKVKALGVTSLKRSPLLPLVPTLDELGIAGYEVNTWFGFVAPARTPQDIVARLNVELTRIFASAEAREKLGPQGFDLAPPMAPAMFAKLISRRPRDVGADRQGIRSHGELTAQCQAAGCIPGSGEVAHELAVEREFAVRDPASLVVVDQFRHCRRGDRRRGRAAARRL